MGFALGPSIPASKARLERTLSSGQNSSYHIPLPLQHEESRESNSNGDEESEAKTS